jgi:hypothetical protein
MIVAAGSVLAIAVISRLVSERGRMDRNDRELALGKPLLFKITGVWGNHEGSMLLWVLILVLFGALVGAFGGNLPPAEGATLVQGWVTVAFLLFICLPPTRSTGCPAAARRGRTSTRSFRTSVWRSIRRCSISAMSASRSPSPSPSPR